MIATTALSEVGRPRQRIRMNFWATLHKLSQRPSLDLGLSAVCVSVRPALCPKYVTQITAPIMHWGHPQLSMVCMCLCVFQPLDRRCAYLGPNLACFILCFHANPTRSTNGRLEEEFKTLSALMSTLTVYMLIRTTITLNRNLVFNVL